MKSLYGTRFVLFPVLLGLVACGNPFPAKGKLVTSTNLSSAESTFEPIRSQVIEPHCLRCHGQYSSADAVASALPRIISRVESGSMPQGGPKLSASLIKLLKEWKPYANPQPVPLEANWKSISTNLLGPKCMSCHNPNGQALFLDLSSREAIFRERNRLSVDNQKLIDFDDPDMSYLLVRVKDEADPMPPSYADIELLTEKEKAVLRTWIEQGLP